MTRREFLMLLGGALGCSITLAARAGAQQLSPSSRSAPPAQPPPQPVPQVAPRLNVPGPQMAPVGARQSGPATRAARRKGPCGERRPHPPARLNPEPSAFSTAIPLVFDRRPLSTSIAADFSNRHSHYRRRLASSRMLGDLPAIRDGRRAHDRGAHYLGSRTDPPAPVGAPARSAPV